MAAITKRLLHLRPNFQSRTRPHPYPLHHFSSSSDPDAKSDISQPDPNSEFRTRPSPSSGISSVEASLHQPPPLQNRDRRSPSPSRANSADDIRRHISEFRNRSAAPPPSSSTDNYVSMQEIYERNVSKGDGSANSSGIDSWGNPSLNPISPGLRQNPGAQNDSGRKLSELWSMSQFTENLKRKADVNVNRDSTTFSRLSNSSMSAFLRGKGDKSLYGLTYGSANDHEDMGKKLKMLRPQNRKGKWFSLQELSDRLAKLKEAQKEENDTVAKVRAGIFLSKQAERKAPFKKLSLLGGTESYDMSPPKTDLVDQYFHPDNLSSAEKLKLELQKVREEFKMSESDCGSTRVQVAQLTLKIKHLSTVLQKKDKHSRKGLQAMVERRKKLLKYLRRTDWESYCLVLSKLGLRDNPDIKA